MKALVFSMLAIASLVACTNESDPINEVDNEKPVEIKLNAGIITTKAPIDSENNLPKTKVTGIQIVQAPEAEDAVWTGVSAVASTAEIGTDGAMVFTGEKLYYNADESKKTFLIGYYPTPTNIRDGVASWTITGKEDIIATGVVSGDKTKKDTPLSFEFKHLLTQLQIEIKGNAAAQAVFGKITGIKIIAAKTSASLTLGSASLTWSGAADKSINVWSGVEGSESNTLDATLSDSFEKIGYVMLAPATKYTVEVMSENITTSEEITITNTAVAGSAHKIALTFNGSEVSASATLTGWVTSADGGTGTID